MYLVNEDELQAVKDPYVPPAAQHMDRYAKPLYSAGEDMVRASKNPTWSPKERLVAHNDAVDRYESYLEQVCPLHRDSILCTQPDIVDDTVESNEALMEDTVKYLPAKKQINAKRIWGICL